MHNASADRFRRMAVAGLLLLLSMASVPAYADTFTTLSGEKYTHATVTRVEPDGIVVMSDSGVTKIQFLQLPEAVRKKYGYDAQRAQAFAAEKARKESEAIQEAARSVHSPSTSQPQTSLSPGQSTNNQATADLPANQEATASSINEPSRTEDNNHFSSNVTSIRRYFHFSRTTAQVVWLAFVFVVSSFVSLVFLRVTARIIVGFTPWFGNAFFAMLLAYLAQLAVAFLFALLIGRPPGTTELLILIITVFLLHAAIYGASIKDPTGEGIGFRSGVFIALLLPILATVTAGVVFFGVFAIYTRGDLSGTNPDVIINTNTGMARVIDRVQDLWPDTSTAAPVKSTAAEPPVPPRLPTAVLNAVVTISGSHGHATGFICQFQGKTFVATNQHVLEVGPPFMLQTNAGTRLIPQRFFAAGDADLALVECASIPAGIKPLELATLPDPAIQAGDAVMIPGNSKGDDVITQTPGKLVAIGPQRVEVDNPTYPGNSGSPIIHMASGKVIAVMTEAELITLNKFEKRSFNSKNSAIKSDIRYFGHRIDTVKNWDPLSWDTFQNTESMLSRSREELLDIISYLTGCDDSYKQFRDLRIARQNAVYRVRVAEHNGSGADRNAAYNGFLRDIEGLAWRAEMRFHNRPIYHMQREQVETIEEIANLIRDAMKMAEDDGGDVPDLLLMRADWSD